MASFENKNVFITGGASGIGRALAESFAADGAKVCIGDISDGSEFANSIGGAYYKLDVSDEDNTRAVYQAIEKEYGKLDIICLFAGVALEDTILEEFDMTKARKMVDINLMGVMLGLKYGTRHMNDNGSIITAGSAAGGGMTVAMQGVYSATKAGVHYLTRTVAIEQGSRGIRANTLCPASIAGTGMMVDEDESAEAKFFGGITALGRMGRPADVVNITKFLASDDAGFITGGEFTVDGGLTAGLSNNVIEAMWSD
ncbi:SDR family NAD(P)-dependent oxidoreductase [Pseudomonadota bacterium]|jgi:NAD(P)-dependent dehydrogenase (short-subunit alcohol dehydrogenase family)